VRLEAIDCGGSHAAMTLYGLRAKGVLVNFNSTHTILCGKLFKTEERAKEYIPTFRGACTKVTGTARDLMNLADDDHLTVSVISFELEDGS